MIVRTNYTAKRNVYAFGRNGTMQCVGLELSANGGVVMIEPVNTRGVGRCNIQIPAEDIDNVIRALEDCKRTC